MCRRYSEWHSEWHAEAALGRVGGINESDALPLAWLCGTVRAEVMQHEVLLQARRKGRSTIGFIQSLISIATSFGSASIILMLVLVILTMLAAVTTGSGNAPFYAFVEMIPKLAHSSGINPAYLTIPMLQASNLGRTLSPVSGVVVAVAGMAKISPFEVVKRTSVPVLVGLVIVIVATELMVPGTAAAVTGK